MAMVLVTHDLGVVAGRTDEIAVMYAGQIVEQAPTATLFAQMRIPYTEALLRVDPAGREPEPHPARGHQRPAARPRQPAPGAGSRPRCPYAQDRCREEEPPLIEADGPATGTAAGTRSAPTAGRKRWSATWPPGCRRPSWRSPAT